MMAMDQMISAMNRVQDALASVHLDLNLDLPQIAVVGGQSAGKSSILECVVGRAFLPSGTGVVTRRPLILQLANTHLSGSDREWGEFKHAPGKQFDDFDEIREEIVRETERVCGTRQVISHEPIILRVSSPRVVDLTLVDLPGITRVPVGDQPADIERHIRELVLSHIKNPRCLILAIVAGNADLATADALAISREVDPQGHRTIGVVTKLDLVDNAADTLAVLEGRVYPLHLGFVGVTCRSFKDVQARTELKEHAQKEEQFFQNHPVFRSIASRCGISYLSKFLNGMLMDHIFASFPDIRQHVVHRIHQLEGELESFGGVLPHKGEMGHLLLGIFNKFSQRFLRGIEGTITEELGLQPGTLTGRARIDYIFRDMFTPIIRDFDSLSGLTDDEIRVTVQNATGPRATLFVPEAAFEVLVKKQIAKLEGPCVQCAELVFEALQQVALLSEVPEFKRFPKLRERVFGVVNGILRRHLEPATQMLRDLIQIELAYINTNHPDFVGMGGAMRMAKANPRHAEGASTPSPPPPVAPVQPPPAPESQESTTGGFFSTFFAPRNQRRPRGTTDSQGALDGLNPPRPIFQSANTVPLSQLRTFTPPRRSLPGGIKLPSVPSTITPTAATMSSRERVEVDIIKSLLFNYMFLVKKNVADSVPKAIVHFMVNSANDVLQRELVVVLYKEDLFESLFSEESGLPSRREKCRAEKKALDRVIEVMEVARDGVES
mmetsp:Transcript_39846/g.105647  ORF Transcript_39846/g.105647 Transcript_39846/m.105647 type:complete len:722 (-) Transcript_39846:119-2284(-)|eukprot:CAMPEP_0194526726 /NCGR_PEP_ID=MMETSP0253-20130528/62605_1 /TAXON_ID=2966 /ORGANISM="Noctiluca scintillans" /LENGTH=721 /DNA_ID=CAMNT_0039371583 /DNA_START=23 /DNA_END=2188 /DNA_ORIENTATION=-